MFFINAEALGEDFFTSKEALHGNDGLNLDPSLKSKFVSERTRQYAAWVISTVIPLFNEANPACSLNPERGMVRGRRRTGRDTPIHRDGGSYANRTFVTLSYGMGTLFPRLLGYEDVDTATLSFEEIRRDFLRPLPKHAAVFDPDTELHAAPPTYDIFFRAELDRYVTDNTKVRAVIPIICPNSPLCTDPFKS